MTVYAADNERGVIFKYVGVYGLCWELGKKRICKPEFTTLTPSSE
jgi:hypothetical protein